MRSEMLPGRLFRSRLSAMILGCGICLVGLISPSLRAEEIRPATDRPRPKPPAESAACVALPEGFRIELVAAEPLVRDPSAMAFDERGRLFVGEIHGYNLDGYLDILELNKTGKLDREVRRVRHATPESQAAALKETYGTVKLLRDTDGDGRMDAADVWADRLPPCYGVIAARGGVIAICAPDIVYLADRDGDGRAEVRETLFTGFARELIERGMSNPRWGVDNWIYVAAGGGGGTITGPNISESVVIGQTDFRFRPDGSAIEPVTGRESMFGLTINDFGDRFHTIMAYTSPLSHRYLARNPHVQSPPGDVGINPTRQLFPISQPDPWRKARGQDPAWVKFYGAAETLPNGQFTASSGQMIYRADAWPAAYRGNYFVCDPANNLIHRCLLERHGAEYTARRAPENEASEFLASTDQWFRPINLSVGPDGAVYIVDMYREIIEDFSAIPRFLQQQYAESLVAGQDHGRVWKLSWIGDDNAGSQSKALPFDSTSVEKLIPVLDHANHWRRETAQRLIIERGNPSVRAALAQFVRNGKTPQGRVHALYTLEGLSLLTAEDVLAGLKDESELVRLQALPLADRWLDDRPAVLDRVLQLIDDPEPRVRIQTALTLGEIRHPRAVAALAQLAVQHGDERWMSAAIVSSLAGIEQEFLERLLKADQKVPGVLALLVPIAETVGARRDEQTVGRCLQQIAAVDGPAGLRTQLVFLDGLVRGLERGKPEPLQSDIIVAGLERLLASSSADVSDRSVQVAGLLQLHDSPAMQAAWKSAVDTARNEDQPLPRRLAAVSLLSVAPWQHQQPLHELLAARHPAELQLAVVKAFSRADHEEVRESLFANWAGLGPKVQEAVVDACFSRQDRLPWLLDAVEQELVPATMISALRREQLSEHGDDAIRERARELLARRVNDDRAAVIKRYQNALTLPRDPRHGEELYLKTCARCHKLGDKGVEVGPDLLAVRTRPDESLLIDLLDPSGALARGYTVYLVQTTSGRVHTGLLAAETATSVTLRSAAEPTAKSAKPVVVEESILRKDIEAMKALSKSLMPEGLEKELKPQDVADLIGFLRHSLGPVIAPGVVLFDDEPAFVAALTDGGAEATLTKDDRHAGDVALRVTAGQRHSASIKGWSFPIVENPKSDSETRSFRYLRFAWKSIDANGVMLELAASGSWPPADKPIRRYYSGSNTSGWAAVEVSAKTPGEWTVVTVDLWKDGGDFTLTGIAPTAMNGTALFDKFELLPAIP